MTWRRIGALGLLLTAAACSSSGPRDSGPGQQASAAIGVYKLGRPYEINGRQYVPTFDPAYSQVGIASWYGDYFHGRATANGESFDKDAISAAHPTLPLPSLVRVTNLDNNRVLVLRVNDRGPFVGDRLIDLSQGAARELGYEQQGLARVKVDFVQLAEAKGTPPAPTVVAQRSAPEPRPGSSFTGERIQVAKLEPAPLAPAYRGSTITDAPPVASCPVGPQWVQVGAFRDQARVKTALNDLEDLQSVKIDPVMVAGAPAMRVRLGPMVNPGQAAKLLSDVRRLGYTTAFLATIDGSAQVKRC